MSEQVQLAIVTGIVTIALALISSWRLRPRHPALIDEGETSGHVPEMIPRLSAS